MRTVLITGANRGVGLALTKCFLDVGTAVIACCRNPAGADNLVALQAVAGEQLRIAQLDVANGASIQRLKQELGEQPIDVLINNAGVIGPADVDQSYLHVDAQAWLNTMRINGLAPILIAQALRKNLICGSEKKLVAISSHAGATGADYYEGSAQGSYRYAYRASKAALNNGMAQLARDWEFEGIAVLVVNPGWVQIEMGGPFAATSTDALSPSESAKSIISRISELTLENSGSFVNYDGKILCW